MSEIYIRDSVQIALPGNLYVPAHRPIDISIKDNIQRIELKSKALEIVVDATHCGYFNRNAYFYTHDGMARTVRTFVEPYGKPILTEHDPNSKPIGRATAAVFQPIPRGTYPVDSDDARYRGRPTGKIVVKSLVTEPEGIMDVLSRRFLTVSVGGRPQSVPVCSICKAPVTMGLHGPELTCEHDLGTLSDKKKYIGIIADGVNYEEYSFVNNPADTTDSHFAGVVSMTLVDYNGSLDGVSDSVFFGANYMFDSVKPDKEANEMAEREKLVARATELGITVTEDMTDEALAAMIKEKETPQTPPSSSEAPSTDQPAQDAAGTTESEPVRTFDELVQEAEKALENCPGCDEDISEFWKDSSEDDIKALDQLIAEYDAYISEDPDGLIMEDAKLSTEKRKSLPAGAFCGPNKSFPVPDCAHVTAARKLIGRYKGPGSKEKILACVNRKAKGMGCDSTKDSNEDKSLLQKLEEHITASQKQNDAYQAEIKALNDQMAMKDASIAAADEKIVELTRDLTDAKVEKLLDLSILTKRSTVQKITDSTNTEEFAKNYNEAKAEYLTRGLVSLNDSIKDAQKDMKWCPISNKIDNPVLDKTTVMKNPFEEIRAARQARKIEKEERINKIFSVGYIAENEEGGKNNG